VLVGKLVLAAGLGFSEKADLSHQHRHPVGTVRRVPVITSIERAGMALKSVASDTGATGGALFKDYLEYV